MKRLIFRAFGALAAIGVLLAAWAFFWEPGRLVIRETSIALPCWRGGPIRIAVVSDLHTGSPHNGLDKLDRVVDAIQSGRPDVIVLLGDYVIQDVAGGRFVTPERIAQSLARLRASLGVYAVLGNHDWWLNAPRVQRALQSAHITVLEDTAIRIHGDGQSFWLAGISDYWEGAHDVRRALSNVTGRQRYAIGHIHEHGKELFVTAGVGTSIIPVRFRVPPEVVFLEVRGPR